MDNSTLTRKRKTFRWTTQARELANANLKATGFQLRQLVTQLVQMTGYPRSACRRFVRRMGNKAKNGYKRWPASEQERLLKILDELKVREAAHKMRCSPSAIYGMLRRLHVTAGMRQDCISKSKLAAAFHVHIYVVDSWINKAMLKATVIQVGKATRTMIKPDDLFQFCEQYREEVIGNRLNIERIEFIYKYLFPPDHNHLFSVRKHKKERSIVAPTLGKGLDEEHAELVGSQSEAINTGEQATVQISAVSGNSGNEVNQCSTQV